jgi:hypothetical protein
MDFYIQPGTNNISAYYSSGTTAASSIIMFWRNAYWSADGVE